MTHLGGSIHLSTQVRDVTTFLWVRKGRDGEGISGGLGTKAGLFPLLIPLCKGKEGTQCMSEVERGAFYSTEWGRTLQRAELGETENGDNTANTSLEAERWNMQIPRS